MSWRLNWRVSMLIGGAFLMLLGVGLYLTRSTRAASQVAISGQSLNRAALVAPPPPTVEPARPIKPGRPVRPINPGRPIRPARPINPAPAPPPPAPAPAESTGPDDQRTPEPVFIPKPVIDPQKVVRPGPTPPDEVLYRIVVPRPTPQLFHQEEVEGDYPGLLEKGVTERIRIRLIRKLVESPRQIDETKGQGERTQLTESIEPVPGRPLDVPLEESLGADYEAWIRCSLESPRLALTPVEASSADWRRLGSELRLDWEWLVRTDSAVVQQQIAAVMEIEWRPKTPGLNGSRTVGHRLWEANLVVTVADPLFKSGQVEVVSPIVGGSGALLMLIAVLPIGRRRREQRQGAAPESGPSPRFDFKSAKRPATPTTLATPATPATPAGLPRSAPGANLDLPTDQQQDVVECSVFAPPLAPQGETVMIQVFAHLEGRDDEAARLAVGFDPTATPRGVKTLSSRVARGTELTFHLTLSRLEIAEPIQTLVWMGDTESVQFIVDVPVDWRLGNLAGSVTISQQTVPIGRISFLLRVVPAGTAVPDATDATEAAAHAFRYTFISYASEDRDKVLARVQMLDQMGIRYFQDLLSLDPGQRWEKELYRNIDQCDLFLLFWSNAAKRSEWVMREVDYAIDRKGGQDDSPPEIRPVIIEGPPLVTPPEKLKHLHFNDRLIYLMSRSGEK